VDDVCGKSSCGSVERRSAYVVCETECSHRKVDVDKMEYVCGICVTKFSFVVYV
jgi:hypothetical protein